MYARFSIVTKSITCIIEIGRYFVCISRNEFVTLFGFNEIGKLLIYNYEVYLHKKVSLVEKISESRFMIVYTTGDTDLFTIQYNMLHHLKFE